jgi:hypothetical protein
MLRTLFGLTIAGLLAACVACSSPPASNRNAASAAAAEPGTGPAQPQVPADIQSAAESILGNEAEVLAHGDLARSGREQVLVINRLHQPGQGVVAGILFTRLTVIENDGGQWKQILLCDEHLKNAQGFLVGAPVRPVTVWRLQFEQDPNKGLLLFLTPYNQNAQQHTASVEVSWNRAVGRYQVLSPITQQFLGENPDLQNPQRELK